MDHNLPTPVAEKRITVSGFRGQHVKGLALFLEAQATEIISVLREMSLKEMGQGVCDEKGLREMSLKMGSEFSSKMSFL